MENKLILNTEETSELEHAARRNNATREDIKVLSSGFMFSRILPVLRGYGQVVKNIFKFLGEVACPGTTSFVVRRNFVLNTTSDTKVRICYLGDNFKAEFLQRSEVNVPESVLIYGDLLKNSGDEAIILSLGEEEKVEVFLAEIFYLLSISSNRESVLLKSGRANLFYVRDYRGIFRVISVHWFGTGWSIDTHSTHLPLGWGTGCRVFSRK